MILYLDFDGVLHADPVFLRNNQPHLDPEYGALFMWASVLEAALADYPDVRIVLSTSWASVMGFEYARDALPPSLGSRVIDCVWRLSDYPKHGISKRAFNALSRYEQVMLHAKTLGGGEWLAIDNNHHGWPAEMRHRLVLTQDYEGLSDPIAQMDLIKKLHLMHEAEVNSKPA